MKKGILIFFLVISLQGCVLSSLLSTLTPSPSIEANTQVGRQNNQEKTLGASFKEDDINGENVTVIKNFKEVPAWIWLLAILGWMLPSPMEIGRGIGKGFLALVRLIKS